MARAQEASISLTPGYVREPYSASILQTLKEQYKLDLAGASSSPSFQWQAVGAMPPGLSIEPSSGTIFGTPMMARPAPYRFRVNVVDLSSPSPSPLKFLVELKITRGTPAPDASAPRLVPIGLGGESEAEAAHAQGDPVPRVRAQNNDDYEIPTIVPREDLILPVTIKNPVIRQLEFKVFNDSKGVEAIHTQTTPEDVPRGVARTEVKLKLALGVNRIVVTDVDGNIPPHTFYVTLKKTDVNKPPAKTPLDVLHSGFVPKGATTTPVTIYVGDKNISKVKVEVKERVAKDKDATPTALPKYEVKEIELKRSTDEYEVLLPVTSDEKKVTVVQVTEMLPEGATDKPRTKSRDIRTVDVGTAGETAEKPPFEVGYSKFVGDFAMSAPLQITLNDPKISKVKVSVKPKGSIDEKAWVHTEPVEVKHGEPSFLYPVILPGPDVNEMEFQVVGITNDNAEVKDKLRDLKRKKGGAAPSTIVSNSLTTRAIIGFEQAGASSADSKQEPFLDLFFTAPLYFGQKRDEKKKKFDPPRFNNLPTLSAWGQIRLAAIPQQASAIGTFATDFVNPLTDGKLVELVQGFDFLAGLDLRLYGSDKGYLGLVPGIKQRTFVHLVAAYGAISPLTETRRTNAALIYKVPGENSPQRALFVRRFGEAAAEKQNIAFVYPDRDRFLRQFYAGFRFKTFYFNNDSAEPINRFPAILDVMFGQNEAVTGGRLKSVVTNDEGKIIGESRNLVMRLEAFYPFPIREASFLYLYGTAMMKLGGKGVKITTPLFLSKSDGDVSLTSDSVFIAPNLQTDRDYYRIGIGVNLTELFNRRRPRNQ
ncbi:MAG TPA: Ig domain-containing protein [Pyrinomonadaceae bacterium]